MALTERALILTQSTSFLPHDFFAHHTVTALAVADSRMKATQQQGSSSAAAAGGSGGSREARVAAHSHIKGLGLADDGTAMQAAHGFIGQKTAREVSGSANRLA